VFFTFNVFYISLVTNAIQGTPGSILRTSLGAPILEFPWSQKLINWVKPLVIKW